MSRLPGDTAPYDDTVVTFRQTQFATGRRYDAYGATWWLNLPPSYNDANYNPADPAHESPPRGWICGDGTAWKWSDGAVTFLVLVGKPGTATGTPYGMIAISKSLGPAENWNRA